MQDAQKLTNNQPSPDQEILAQARSLAMIHTRTVVGVNALPVIVEVHLANGLPIFSTVGLPEAAVKESKDRVRGAILNSGFEFPAKRITVNLSPADLPKTGSRFDLPIAIGILAASGQVPSTALNGFEFVGELALDGQLRKIAGVLPTALACGGADRELIVPTANAEEAALAEHTDSRHAPHLLTVCRHLAGHAEMDICIQAKRVPGFTDYPDLCDVKGQAQAKRALEIAASGGHSLLFMGPPGAGKSMLASRLPGILPELNTDEALQAAAIQSVANGDFDIANWKQRPFRNPHHSASSVALVGGGSHPRPGEISLAHKGILFLDELTEFSRATLEQLREPLETGKINIARASQSAQYPAEFMLIAACNPCPCGYLNDGTDRCSCSVGKVDNYRAKLSGPMLDRIDMHVHLPRVSTKELQAIDPNIERSEQVKNRVDKVRLIQDRRQGRQNSRLEGAMLEQQCRLDEPTKQFLELAGDRLHLSARAYHRILKLARTIADMADVERIAKLHVSEAIAYRSLDRRV
jgi:magnesium chelatase family protein